MNNPAENLAIKYKKILDNLKGKTLIAVSKYTTLEKISWAYHLGIRDFGESKVQDLQKKTLQLPSDIRWHFIGSLQKNKINTLLKIPNLYAIHSVDSLELMKAIIFRSNEIEHQIIKLFMQFNTSFEEQKGGFNTIDECVNCIDYLRESQTSKLQIEGLMTIGKIRTDDFEKDAKRSFQMLKDYKMKLDNLYNLDLKLSMGMSDDYILALEEGSDFVRIGGALFDD